MTGYHIASGQGILARYVVQTCQGDFDFLPSIGNVALLLAIIQRFAVQTPIHDWQSQTDVNALGGESARWSGGKIGSGAHIYHYRTPLNRALLWMPLVLWLIAGLIRDNASNCVW
ncbi:MAG: hypothetical protein ACRYFS_02705 [Janthinobacterium lividum]